MRIAGFKSPLTLGLATACAGLGVVVALQLLFSTAMLKSPISPPAKEETTAVIKGRFSLPPEAEFSEIVERPLFMRTRRPPKPDEKGDAQNKQTQLGQYQLTGVILTPDQRLALLRNTASKKIERVNEGKENQGWTLKEVHADSVLLDRNGEDESLALVRKTPDNVKQLAQSAAATRKARKPVKRKTEKPPQTPASQQVPHGQQPRPPNKAASATPPEE